MANPFRKVFLFQAPKYIHFEIAVHFNFGATVDGFVT